MKRLVVALAAVTASAAVTPASAQYTGQYGDRSSWGTPYYNNYPYNWSGGYYRNKLGEGTSVKTYRGRHAPRGRRVVRRHEQVPQVGFYADPETFVSRSW